MTCPDQDRDYTAMGPCSNPQCQVHKEREMEFKQGDRVAVYAYERAAEMNEEHRQAREERS